MELWNETMRRWVKPRSKGIALIRKNAGGRPHLEYVFDVADTRPVKGARTPYLWEVRPEHHSAVVEALERQYGLSKETDFGHQLMEQASRAVSEIYRDRLNDLAYDAADSFLEGLDGLNLEVRFRNLLTASVQYTLLTRCGLNPADYLSGQDRSQSDEAERRGRGDESQQSDGLGTGGEQLHSPGGGNGVGGDRLQVNPEDEQTAGGQPAVSVSDGPDLSLFSLFPTVEEQIENIAQAQSEEQQTLQQQTSLPIAQVPDAVIGRALTSGGNDAHSIEHIVAFFQKSSDNFTAAAYQRDRNLLRFRPSMNPTVLASRIQAMNQPVTMFKAMEGFTPAKASFITEDEISRLLMCGSNISESKLRIYAYFKQGHDAKECAEFLRHEYGDGGYSYSGYDKYHNSKGIRFTRSNQESGFKGYDTVQLNWNQVQKRVRALIDSDQYLTLSEKNLLPEYENRQLARRICGFYRNDPNQTNPSGDDLDTAEKKILAILTADDSEKKTELFHEMADIMAAVPPDSPEHQKWNEVFADVTIASAILDRVLHHCTVINIKGESYRLKERKEFMRQKQQIVITLFQQGDA